MHSPRIPYIITTLLSTLACYFIVLYTKELGSIRGWIGDIMIIIWLYSLIQSIWPYRIIPTLICVLCTAYLIEGLQYIDFLDLIGGSDSRILSLIFGAVFDPYDLIAYTIGGVIIFSYEKSRA